MREEREEGRERRSEGGRERGARDDLTLTHGTKRRRTQIHTPRPHPADTAAPIHSGMSFPWKSTSRRTIAMEDAARIGSAMYARASGAADRRTNRRSAICRPTERIPAKMGEMSQEATI